MQTVTAILLGLGAIQAVIGVIRKFGLTGNTLVVVSLAVVIVLRLVAMYFGDSVVFQNVMESIIGVLAAMGYWRYRNGEPQVIVPDDEDLTTV